MNWPRVRKYLFIILFIVGSYVVHEQVLKVKEISCHQEAATNCPNSVMLILNKYQGTSMVSLRYSQISEQIKATGLVDSVKISSSLPGKLAISIKAPQEVFDLNIVVTQEIPYFESLDSSTSAYLRPTIEIDRFLASVSGQFYTLFPSGTISSSQNPSTVVYIANSLPSVEIGRQIYAWLQALNTQTSKLDQVFIVRDFVLTSLSAGFDCLLPLDQEPQSRLLALQQIISLATIKPIRIIDFRFKHPILK